MSDVLIVGGGVIGSAVAIELAARGVSVTVVEAQEAGTGATGASAGMLAPRYEAGGPTPLFHLGVEGRTRWPAFARWVEELGDWLVGFRVDGMLVANRTEEEERGAREELAWQREVERGREDPLADSVGAGQDPESPTLEPAAPETAAAGDAAPAILTPAEAREIHPRISPAIRSWLWLPEEAQVDAQRLAVVLGAAAREAGARLLQGRRVTEVLAREGRVAGVRDEGWAEHPAGAVILAAGAWSGGIAGLPRELPVRPVRGQILRLRPSTPGPGPLVASHEGRYLVPRENGTVLVGSTMEEVGFDDSVTEEGRALLAEHAQWLIPELAEGEIVESWAGLRPMTPDGAPILGPEPRLEGLFYATGHGRNGVLLAPVTARLMADVVLSGESDVDWRPFGVERFSSSDWIP